MKHIKLFEQFINESHFTAGDSVECIDSGMIGSVIGSTGEGDEEIYIVSINGETKEYSPEELRLVESVVNEGKFVVWYEDKEGKHILGTFRNKKAADKYKSEEEDEVLNTAGVEAIGTMSKDIWDKKEAPYIKEAVINEMDSEAALLLAVEVSGEVYTAKLKGKSATIKATTTTKTWDDGVPVLKYLARGSAKSIKFELYQRPFKVIHDVAHDWFYFTDGGKWYGLHSSDGYYEPSDLPFEMTLD